MTNGYSAIVGHSSAMQRLLGLADRFAPTAIPVLLVGATGTGKELFAERIHQKSGRRGHLVPVNCGALPRDMVESLLFGHHRGAFTGAVEATLGFVQAADGGTLFLDELSSLPAEAQVKLLRVLESKQVTRLGETRTRTVDFRVIASGQDDMPSRVHGGQFRLDLYQRVAGVVLELPPLRERLEDVVLLAEHFAALGNRTLHEGSIAVLISHSWPGNVRELRTAIERAAFLSDNGALGAEAVAEAIALGAPTNGAAHGSSVGVNGRDQAERHRLVRACGENDWDVRRTAQALGMSSSTLYRRLHELRISLRAFRGQVPNGLRKAEVLAQRD